MKRRKFLNCSFCLAFVLLFPILAMGQGFNPEVSTLGQDQIPWSKQLIRWQKNLPHWLQKTYPTDPFEQKFHLPETVRLLRIDNQPALAFKTWEYAGLIQHLVVRKNGSQLIDYATPHGSFNRNGNQVFPALLGIEIPDDQFSDLDSDAVWDPLETARQAPMTAAKMRTSFGTLLGVFNNRNLYSNGSTSYFSGKTNSYGSYVTGYKWQCVEWIVRYYAAIYQLYIRGGNANSFYSAATSKGLLRFPNGSSSPPQPGDILCSAGGTYGHVAIIREVDLNAGLVYYCQQNWFQDSRDVRRKMILTQKNGTYTLANFSNSYPIQGWLRAPALKNLPGSVVVTPTTGNWTATPQNIAVSSLNADQIFYSLTNTLDGSEPTDPTAPTAQNSSISGSSGDFQFFAPAGLLKRLKIKFRGYNSLGYGATSQTYSYQINLLPPSESIAITNPTPGEIWKTGRSHTIRWTSTNLSASVRLAIYFSLDNGNNWISLDSDTANDGEKNWDMPHDSRLKSTKSARIKIVSRANSATYAISEPFEIVKE